MQHGRSSFDGSDAFLTKCIFFGLVCARPALNPSSVIGPPHLRPVFQVTTLQTDDGGGEKHFFFTSPGRQQLLVVSQLASEWEEEEGRIICSWPDRGGGINCARRHAAAHTDFTDISLPAAPRNEQHMQSSLSLTPREDGSMDG